MFTLDFRPNEETEVRKTRYDICIQALLFPQRQLKLEEWEAAAGLMKAMKAIGRREDKPLSNGVFLYTLETTPYGAPVQLERAEYKLLLDYIKQPSWKPDSIETVLETLSWLESLKDERKLSSVSA